MFGKWSPLFINLNSINDPLRTLIFFYFIAAEMKKKSTHSNKKYAFIQNLETSNQTRPHDLSNKATLTL